MTHASLFSGIGGFDLAAEWAGWTNAFNCEIDPFCRKILKYHFPDAEQYGDIRTADFAVWRDRIDVLTGGFPCQPFSLAGKRKGTEDDRYLWPEMLRVSTSSSTAGRPWSIDGRAMKVIVSFSGGKDSLAASYYELLCE
jgi:DNA (cytosine-5)-methyltransferase 1